MVYPTEASANTIEDRPKKVDPNDDYPMSVCRSRDRLLPDEVREFPATVVAGCSAASVTVNVLWDGPNTIVITYTGYSTPDPPGDGYAFYGDANSWVYIDLSFDAPGHLELTHKPQLVEGVNGSAGTSILFRELFVYNCAPDVGCSAPPPVELIEVPAAGDYRLVFSVGFGGGGTGSGEVTLRFDGDADGDALFDSWETNGIDMDGDGNIDLDLPAMGADPLRKDIFVEVDWMSPLSFAPPAAEIVVDAFAAAPVGNPDGSTGITMHIDNGPSSVMNPLTGGLWGDLSRGNAIPYATVLGTFDPSGDYDWAAFDAIKADHFPAERRPAFHYVIIGDRYGSVDETSSGISRGIMASDFLVTLGSLAVPGGTAYEQAGTFMHELGHNLGLRHGGFSDTNRKPNYLSIMNYAFQFSGLYHNGTAGLYDYSRFGPASLGQLQETALSEEDGLLAPPSMLPYKSTFACFPPGQTLGSWELVDVVGVVDWNCDGGMNAGTVEADINNDGALTTMDAFEDWPNLVFGGGLIGGLGAGAALPGVTPVIEPPLTEILETTRVLAPFDLYLDGRVDLRDVALFQACFASEPGGRGARCLAADFNADAVVDLTDHGRLANALTGP
jgi:hypothetical protein